MSILLLARHGETEWNVLGRRQGQLDSPLTDRGYLHARRLAALAENLAVTSVFSSPLGRALTTATTCALRLGVPVTVIDQLAELDHGEMAGLTTAEIMQRYPERWQQRVLDKYSWRFPGGESYADVYLRAGQALNRIAAFASARPLVVSHEMIGRMLIKNLRDLPPAEALGLNQPHDVVYEVDPAGGALRALRCSAWTGEDE